MQDKLMSEAWDTHKCRGPIYPTMTFAPEGLVLGAGTILLQTGGLRRLKSTHSQELRILALLSAFHGQPLATSVLGNIKRAVKCWNDGDHCLAYIHLAHAKLKTPDDLSSAACRLLVADRTIKAGINPRAIFQALTLKAGNSQTDAVKKAFNPDEPRIPAGSGSTSGEWTNSDEKSGDGVAMDATRGEQTAEQKTQESSLLASMPLPASSFLEELSAAQVAELGAYASRLIGLSTVSAAAAVFGLLFIPSPNDVHVEGEVSGVPGLRYSWNRDEALLHFTYGTSDGEQRTFAASVNGDTLYDKQGRVIGRVLPDGGILIESAAASSGLVKEEEPRLCPVPGPDKPNERGRAYENYVKSFVNPPPNTTPSGIGFQLPNPKDAGKSVHYDDCRLTTGMMAEAKGPGYDSLLAASNSTPVPEWSSVVQEWWEESGRQVAASGGRPVRWYFAELPIALFARQMFDNDKDGGAAKYPSRIPTLVQREAVMGYVPFAYSIRATGTVHPDNPPEIGERFVRTLDAITRINPLIFSNWEITDRPRKTSVPLAAARPRIGTIIEDNISRDDWDEPDPFYGYSVMAYTCGVATSSRVTLWIIAGGKHPGHIWLQTGSWQVTADPSIVTFPVFKAALLALVANWSLPWICARAFRSNYAMVPVHGEAGYMLESRPMLPQEPTFPRSPFEIPWIGYLSADLAAGVKLTSEIETERTADGGLLMIATEDRLDPNNPEHRRRARIIAETMIACTDWKPRADAQR